MVSQSRNFFGTFYVLFVCLFCFCISNRLSPEEETPKIRYLYHIIFSNTLLYRTHFKILNNIISLKRLFIPKANFHLTVENHDITFKQNGTKEIPMWVFLTLFRNISENGIHTAWNWFVFFVSCTFTTKFRPVSLAAALLHHVAFKCRSQFISFLLLCFLSVTIRVMGHTRSLTKHSAFAWPRLQFLLQTHVSLMKPKY